MASSKTLASKDIVDDLRAVVLNDKSKTELSAQISLLRENLSSAPLAICFLGHISLIAGSTNQEISLETGEKKFELLKNPKSFRACLTELSNKGYWAFLKADGNMDYIRRATAQIPNDMQDIVEILTEGTPEEVEEHLPIVLDSLKEIGENCKTKVQEVVDHFDEVMKTIMEVEEGGQSKLPEIQKALKDLHEARERVKLEEENLKVKKDAFEKDKKKLENQYDEDNQLLKTTLKDYYQGNNNHCPHGRCDKICHQCKQVDATRAKFNATAAALEKCKNEEQVNREKLKDTLDRMSSYRQETATTEETLTFLQMGTEAFGELKTKWSSLLQLFDQMLNMISLSMDKPLTKFRLQVEKTQGKEMTTLKKKLIYRPAVEAIQIGGQVERLTSTYGDVSGKFLLPMISNLGSMISAGGSSNFQVMEEKKEEMKQKALEVQRYIDEAVALSAAQVRGIEDHSV